MLRMNSRRRASAYQPRFSVRPTGQIRAEPRVAVRAVQPADPVDKPGSEAFRIQEIHAPDRVWFVRAGNNG